MDEKTPITVFETAAFNRSATPPGGHGPAKGSGWSASDGARRSSTARVKEACELSLIDQRKFRFMIDEVPNFALYIMGAMARRIRGMSQAM